MFVLGYDGMQRRIADYSPARGWEGLNTMATVGSGVIALAVLVFLVNVAVSLTFRREAGAGPWGGHSLEWATSSPPPPHNFDALPPIRSAQPVLDARERAAAVGVVT
jgi:heme/copper-type cytochrome/quinol oxidase subunit 1